MFVCEAEREAKKMRGGKATKGSGEENMKLSALALVLLGCCSHFLNCPASLFDLKKWLYFIDFPPLLSSSHRSLFQNEFLFEGVRTGACILCVHVFLLSAEQWNSFSFRLFFFKEFSPMFTEKLT